MLDILLRSAYHDTQGLLPTRTRNPNPIATPLLIVPVVQIVLVSSSNHCKSLAVQASQPPQRASFLVAPLTSSPRLRGIVGSVARELPERVLHAAAESIADA